MTPAAAIVLAVAFAFGNQDGSRLLSTGEMAAPEVLRTGICAGGQRVTVQFEGRQADGKDGTGRQTPGNVANTAGTVFRVVGSKVDAGATCLLADETFLTGVTVVPLKRPTQGARCSKGHYPQFQAAKSRPVVACWPIGESPSGVQIAVIEFARRLSHALASLVVIDGDRRMYVDYPAEFRGPGADLWRVDDGGEVHPESFEAVFLLKRGTAYWIVIDWAGTEGNNLSLQTADGEQFKEMLTTYWYRSPL
jgi:hypothetical protein